MSCGECGENEHDVCAKWSEDNKNADYDEADELNL